MAFWGGSPCAPLGCRLPTITMGSLCRYGFLGAPGSSAWLCGVPTSLPPPRFLVHRYSVLRQHAEASGAEGLETADPPSPPYKGGYHDDSDEVSPPPNTMRTPPGLGSLQ